MAISLGEINFGLGADTRALDGSIARLQSFGKAVDAAAKSTADGAREIERNLRRQEQAMVNMVNRVQNMGSKFNKKTFGQSYIEDAQKALDSYIRSMSSRNLSGLGFQRANEKMASQLADIQRRFNSMNVKPPPGELSLWQRALMGIQQSSNLAFGPLSSIGGRVNAFAGILRSGGLAAGVFAAGIAIGGTAVYKIGENALEAGVKIRQLQQQMDAVTGSTAGSNQALREAADIANRAGTSVDSTASAYARFMASAAGTEMEGEKARTMFEAVALASGKMQLSVEDQAGIFRALEQMMSKGTIQAEELRGQLGDRLPGAFQIAARAMGMTTKELGDMMKKGDVLTADFLPKFEAELRKTFNLPTSGGSIDNFNASVNRLQNNMTNFWGEIDRGFGVTDTVKGSIDGIADAVGTLTTNLHDFFGTKGETADTLGALEQGANGQLGTWQALSDKIDVYIQKQGKLKDATILTTQAMINQIEAHQAMAKVELEKAKNAFPDTLSAADNSWTSMNAWTNSFRQGWNSTFAGTNLDGLFNPKDIIAENRAQIKALEDELAKYTEQLKALQAIKAKQPAVPNSENTVLPQSHADAIQGSLKAIDDTVNQTANAIKNLDTSVTQVQIDAAVQKFIDAQGQVQGASSQTATTFINQLQSQKTQLDSQLTVMDHSSTAYQTMAQQSAAYGNQINSLIGILSNLIAKEQELLAVQSKLANTNIPTISGPGNANSGALPYPGLQIDGARANGGPVEAGKAYLVGEKRPEIFIPQVSGSILPSVPSLYGGAGSDMLGGGGTGSTGLSSGMLSGTTQYLTAITSTTEAMKALNLATDAESQANDNLNNSFVKIPVATKQVVKALQETESISQQLADIGGRALESFSDTLIDGLVHGTLTFESFKETALNVLSDVLKALFKFMVLNPLKNMLFGGGTGGGSGLLGGLFSNLFGAARTGMAFDGPITAMRKGGLVNAPTFFRTGSGPVLAGEAGREAIMPLGRNSRGELGVRAHGMGGGMTVNIYAQDAQSVIRSETQVAASMQRALSRGSRNL